MRSQDSYTEIHYDHASSGGEMPKNPCIAELVQN